MRSDARRTLVRVSELKPALRRLFGFEDFRPGQERVVQAAVEELADGVLIELVRVRRRATAVAGLNLGDIQNVIDHQEQMLTALVNGPYRLVLPAGQPLRLDSGRYLGVETPGRWSLRTMTLRVLE